MAGAGRMGGDACFSLCIASLAAQARGRKAVILLAMQSDPATDWQRLTEVYSNMYDEELLNLAADSADLTPVAQEVLRSEMKKRGLDDPRAAKEPPVRRVERSWEPGADLPGEEELYSTDAPREGDREYTWKTQLCECADREEAWQLAAALRQAGIECWFEGPGASSSFAQLDLRNPVLLVAADQLDAAREIAAQPIPQAIIDESRMEVPEFEAPVCPECGAEEPVLEGVEPCNTWLCEACGMQWSEAAADGDRKL